MHSTAKTSTLRRVGESEMAPNRLRPKSVLNNGLGLPKTRLLLFTQYRTLLRLVGTSDNPMHRCNAAPRCRAKSKRTGLPCRSPAVKGDRVCRMHGAGGGAPQGKLNGNFGMVAGRKRPTASRATCGSCSASCAR